MFGWPADHALRLEAGEGERLDELLERHAVLQALRDGDGEAVHHRAEGGAFLVHVDEDLAERAVLVLAGAEEDLVAGDARFLREAAAPRRQAAANRCAGSRGRRRRRRGGCPLLLPLGASAARALRSTASAVACSMRRSISLSVSRLRLPRRRRRRSWRRAAGSAWSRRGRAPSALRPSCQLCS